MPFTITKLAALPVIVVMPAGAGIMQELPEIDRRLTRLLNAQPEPVFVIADLRRISLNLDDVMRAGNSAARSMPSILYHLNIRETLVVTTEPIVRLAAQGIDGSMFGGLSMRVFTTPEAALEYCRGELKIEASLPRRQTG